MSGVIIAIEIALVNTENYPKVQSIVQHGGVLVWVNFGCLSPSRFSHFPCNATRKAIKAHKNLHTN